MNTRINLFIYPNEDLFDFVYCERMPVFRKGGLIGLILQEEGDIKKIKIFNEDKSDIRNITKFSSYEIDDIFYSFQKEIHGFNTHRTNSGYDTSLISIIETNLILVKIRDTCYRSDTKK